MGFTAGHHQFRATVQYARRGGSHARLGLGYPRRTLPSEMTLAEAFLRGDIDVEGGFIDRL